MVNATDLCKKYKQMLSNGAQLVDVRSAGEYASGALPDSINIPLQKLPLHIEQLDKDKGIVLYCVSGQRSSMAARYLAHSGFKNVHDLGSFQNAQNC